MFGWSTFERGWFISMRRMCMECDMDGFGEKYFWSDIGWWCCLGTRCMENGYLFFCCANFC